MSAETQEAGGTLMTALLAVQSEAPSITKSATNPHFKSKFASLDDVMNEINPILTRHGLVWLTLPGREDGEPVLSYRLVHAQTGEALEGSMPLMLKTADPQGQGSALTYARRYSIMAVLGLVTDEDDDGNRAQSASLRSPFGPPASAEVATSARNAIAWLLGESVNSEPVTALVAQIEGRAGGYFPEIAARAVGHVAAAAKTKREAAKQEAPVDDNTEADRAARVAAEMRGQA